MRVGTVNDSQHYPRNILAIITAVGFSLRDAGVKEIRWEKGVEATNEVLKEMEKTLAWRFSEE